ncbi:MAG: tetratricopeptide repeat protein, partial [Thermostichales cyanobacterium BF4_bins_65]
MDSQLHGFLQILREALAAYPVKLSAIRDPKLPQRCLVMLEYSTEAGWSRTAVAQTVQSHLKVLAGSGLQEVILIGKHAQHKQPQWRKTFPLMAKTSQPLRAVSHPLQPPPEPLPVRPPSRPNGRSSGPINDQGPALQEGAELAEAGLILSNRYRVVRTLGSGGFSQTYLARDSQRPGHPFCVVKQLTLSGTDPESLNLTRKLFHREAESLEKLGRHSQIPQLLAYFEEGDKFYLVEEYIEGKPLSQEMDQGRFSEEQAKQILLDLLPVLAFIHENQIIHSDIKPDNIIRRTSDQKLVLIDFGAVKHLQPNNAAKRHTVALGTIGYAPVEQYTGQPQLNSDIYALGMVVIEALTGMQPTQIVHNDQGELDWEKHLPQPLSPSFASILRQMVRVYFSQRYQTANEVLADLQAGAIAEDKTNQANGTNLEAALGLSLKMPTILTWIRQPRQIWGLVGGSLLVLGVLVGGQAWKWRLDSAVAQERFGFGIRQTQLDQWQTAAQAFQQALQRLPLFPQARVALQQAQQHLQSLEQRIQTNRQQLQASPRAIQARLDLAVALYQKGDPEAASTELSTALAFSPGNPQILYHLGRVQALQQQWTQAETSYRQAIQRDPSLTEAYVHLGLALLGQGQADKTQEAVAVLQQAVALSPGNPHPHYVLGQAYSRLADWPNALDHYLMALSLSPIYQRQHHSLGYGLYERSQVARARTTLRQRLQEHPNSPALHFHLGQTYLADRDPQGARRAFQEALQQDPNFVPALVALGSLEREAQRWSAAIDRLNQAVERDPANANARRELGLALLGRAVAEGGSVEAAVSQLRNAVNRNPNDPRSRQALALALVQQQQERAAIEQLQHAVRLNPDASDSRAQLALLLAEQAQTQAAQAQLTQALSRDPGNPTAHLAAASLAASQGNVEQALTQAETAAQLERTAPSRADLTQTLVQSQAAQGLYQNVAQQQGQPQRTPPPTLTRDPRPSAVLSQMNRDQLAPPPSPAVRNLRGPLLDILGTSVVAMAVIYFVGIIGVGAVWGLQTAGVLPPSVNEKQWRAAKHCRKGIALVQEEKWAEAIWEFKAALKLNPNLAVAHYYLGQCWLQRGVLDDAITSFWVVKNLVPNFQEVNAHLIRALLQLARQLMDKREFEAAVEKYRFVLSLYGEDDPARATAHYHLGEALVLTKNSLSVDAGIQELQTAIQINPRYLQAHLGLINAYFQKRDYKAALAAAQRLLNLDPDNPEAALLMAKSLYWQGQLQTAIQQFTSLANQHPGLSEGRVYLALALMQTGQLNRARMELTTVLSMDPKHPLGLFAMAWLLALEGDLEESSRKCELALRYNGRLAPALALQGLLHLEQKRKDAKGQRF